MGDLCRTYGMLMPAGGELKILQGTGRITVVSWIRLRRVVDAPWMRHGCAVLKAFRCRGGFLKFSNWPEHGLLILLDSVTTASDFSANFVPYD